MTHGPELDSQGLSHTEVVAFRRDGYLGPFRALSETSIASVRERIIDEVIGDDAEQTGPAVQCRHLDSRLVYDLCATPSIVERVAGLLGPNLVLWRSNFWCKQPGGAPVAWHQDLTNWPIEPMINVSAWLALDEADMENGCLQIVPGSHLAIHPTCRLNGDPLTDSVATGVIDGAEITPMPLRAGEFFLFSEKLLHHSGANRSDRRRLGFAIRMTVPEVRVDHRELCGGRHRNIIVRGVDAFNMNRVQEPPVRDGPISLVGQGRNLTEEEAVVLGTQYNLADGHAYRPWTEGEHRIVHEASALMRQVDRRDQMTIEGRYFEHFFALGGQTLDPSAFSHFLCFTASAALEVVANHLRLNDLSVALIEPCFDNLADILRRHRIAMSVFPEEGLRAESGRLAELLQEVTADAIFLVSPNNPTGRSFTETAFRQIVEYCQGTGTLLILDACFRFYLPVGETFDQYRILAEADIDCLIVEDTGKTWPTLELKAPFFSVSRRLQASVAHIYSDFLLHVSPFTVSLMDKFVTLSANEDLENVRGVVDTNRRILRRDLRDTVLLSTESDFMSMSWIRVQSPVTGGDAVRQLADVDVHVLPGRQFFWSGASRGDNFFRVALARDPEMFRIASGRIRDAFR